MLDQWSVAPTIWMANLVDVLTGRSWEEIAAGGDGVIADRIGGERVVLRLTDALVAALVGSTPEQLDRAAGPWSQAEESHGKAGPEMLAGFPAALGELAQAAAAVDRNVCCWVCG